MSCLYESLHISGEAKLNETFNISTECKEFCKLDNQTTDGQQNSTLFVAFLESSTTITACKPNKKFVIKFTFRKITDTNCTTFTSSPSPTYASVSTSWADNASISSETPNVTEKNTTRSTEPTISTSTVTDGIDIADSKTTMSTGTSTANPHNSATPLQSKTTSTVTDGIDITERKTTMSTETSTANPHYSATPLHSKTTCTRACSSGAFVGAVLGGAVLGAVITAIVFVVFHDKIPNWRKKMTLDGKTNPVYRTGLEDIQLEHIQTLEGQRTENYNEIIEPTHTQDSSLQQHETDSSRKEDVYNHLHETEKGDRSDNYDHAVLTTADGSGYGMVSIDRKINDNYCEVDPTSISNSATPRSEDNNPYFTLEAQDD